MNKEKIKKICEPIQVNKEKIKKICEPIQVNKEKIKEINKEQEELFTLPNNQDQTFWIIEKKDSPIVCKKEEKNKKVDISVNHSSSLSLDTKRYDNGNCWIEIQKSSKTKDDPLIIVVEEETLTISDPSLVAPTFLRSIHQLTNDIDFILISQLFVCLDQMHNFINGLFSYNYIQDPWINLLFEVEEDEKKKDCIPFDKPHKINTKWSIFLMQRTSIRMFNKMNENLSYFITEYTLAIKELKTEVEALASRYPTKNEYIICKQRFTKSELEQKSSSSNSYFSNCCQYCKGPEYCFTETCTCSHILLLILHLFQTLLKKLSILSDKCQQFFIKLRSTLCSPEPEKKKISLYHIFWGVILFNLTRRVQTII